MAEFSRPATDGGRPDDGRRVLVYNPASGNADHGAELRRLADEYGFRVRETERAGDAVALAAEAVESGATLVAAAGGDGTLNEAVNGIADAGGLGAVTFAVVPTGTGNNFASNVGVESVAHAFEVIESGERRTIDLGHVRPLGIDVDDGDAGRYFLNSCIGGITAEASGATTSDMKERFGVIAYVLTTVETVSEFDALRLEVHTEERDRWSGDAVFVLAGNGRRFPVEKRTQANMEDGLLEVTLVEEGSLVGLAGEAALVRLLGERTENITKLRSAALDVEVLNGDGVEFSLDGEMLATDSLRIETRPAALELPVGAAYEPDPDAGAGIDPEDG